MAAISTAESPHCISGTSPVETSIRDAFHSSREVEPRVAAFFSFGLWFILWDEAFLKRMRSDSPRVTPLLSCSPTCPHVTPVNILLLLITYPSPWLCSSVFLPCWTRPETINVPRQRSQVQLIAAKPTTYGKQGDVWCI